MSTDSFLKATIDIALVPTALLTSAIDNLCQNLLGLGLPEIAMTLQSNQLLVPAGISLYHFSNWAKATAATTNSIFVTTAANIGVETVNQAAGLNSSSTIEDEYKSIHEKLY